MLGEPQLASADRSKSGLQRSRRRGRPGGSWPDLLVQSLTEPDCLLSLQPGQWNPLLRVARRCEVLPRLLAAAGEERIGDGLPEKVREQLQAAAGLVEHHQRGIRWEANRIERALRGLAVRPVLLKGAAYILADLPMARGRLCSDLDILVPTAVLGDVERALRQHGWQPLSSDEYDDHYYRAHMHELPPLRHSERGSVLDVHHGILPRTGRLQPDPELLLASARQIEGSGFRILAPEDMLLHTAAHLFQDGDLSGGLRDLMDLDIMLRHFGRQQVDFWDRLVPRAEQLQLARPLYYALRFSVRILRSPVPEETMLAAAHAAPPWAVRQIMDRLAQRVLIPDSRDGESWARLAAHLALYIRSHWLRMPPGLLLNHLFHKAVRRYRDRREKER